MSRSFYDIVYNIVKACIDEPTITKIMYDGRLNISQTHMYLEMSLEAKLVKRQVTHKTITYTITEKGTRWLKVYEEMYNLLNEGSGQGV